VTLILGLVLLFVGISDFVLAGLLARQRGAASGGLGASDAPPASRILRRTGTVTLVVGAILVVLGLAS
jgi:hypothetical protein